MNTLTHRVSKCDCNGMEQNSSAPLISIVMPAYNAAHYISESIDSILNQDFENFELIITDDCSTDNTVEIISSFKDSRIKLIRTKQNTGSAKYPRELAIEHSSSQCICWIDSDDTVDKDYLSSLWKIKKSTGANIVCSRMMAERDGKLQYTLPNENFDFNRVVSGQEAVMMTLDFPWLINLNGWLCDKNLWTGISTFKSLTINHMDADDFSAREILFNAAKVAFSNTPYHYRLHSEAITKKITYKKFESVITDRLVFDFFTSKYPPAIPAIRRSLCLRMIALIRIYSIHRDTLSDESRMRSFNLLQKYFSKISFSDISKANIPFKIKILLVVPFKLSMQIIKFIN